ncbi:Fe(3+) ABC transporter substrate-binding protein [Desulfosporosinus sp. BICA1-9]|uniref:Fe(3+) ABC transporter substrate-binding protein n=1 Tax=Desulfosporosinus sp. BICA1-9 TaxID=1531958 RepID=UPI00054C43E8|nr:Fe(3+) ABC transporter substrate-binding protein [Desulfosporosinus sp. BICA1-9]KJS47526.1 MAG: iron deficiency-induced protein A [Peptococcaceae bacterium BRH_c23]KJS87174.1 MAG: iron deficiency-induced protein A [Desulfosporosinus sp. BICA1-9]HBW38805.1 Fe(3+) ABC transporter substrate-binding protein [Desulfosporosinus sp.]
MKKRRFAGMLAVLTLAGAVLTGCSATSSTTSVQTESSSPQGEKTSQVVNIYSDRHYETDKLLLEEFSKETGIKVNVIEGKSDELIERLAREGKDSQADLLVTADVGRLHRAKEQGLLQSAESDTLSKNVPENLKDKDNQWYGLTVRARVLVYAKDRVDPSQLSTYEDLTDPKWNKKILVRGSDSIYNQSLLASFIAVNGEERAIAWAKGIVNNMARTPKGSDRDQAKAVVAGEGDVAIMNTYYYGLLLNSSDSEEVKVAKQLGVFFPNQSTTGTHINVSGAGVTASAKNKENAIKLVEFLSSEKAQKQFSEANYEYPANPVVEPSDLLKSWGTFKPQTINLTKLGENNKNAVQIFSQVGWK